MQHLLSVKSSLGIPKALVPGATRKCDKLVDVHASHGWTSISMGSASANSINSRCWSIFVDVDGQLYFSSDWTLLDTDHYVNPLPEISTVSWGKLLPLLFTSVMSPKALWRANLRISMTDMPQQANKLVNKHQTPNTWQWYQMGHKTYRQCSMLRDLWQSCAEKADNREWENRGERQSLQGMYNLAGEEVDLWQAEDGDGDVPPRAKVKRPAPSTRAVLKIRQTRVGGSMQKEC